MGDTTNISWTDHTMNLWMGCMKVSEGCKNCYAERLVTGRMGLDCWGPPATTTRKRTAPSTWRKAETWNRAAEKSGVPAKVFCGSLMDWAEDHPQLDEYRESMWDMIRRTPHLRWQLLTKRADRIADLLPDDWEAGYPNVWLGVSVESTEHEDRIVALGKIPALVRFVSYEPALGPLHHTDLSQIDWLIMGGESGPGFRPMQMEWARHMRAKCTWSGTAFFFKQIAEYRPGTAPVIDGETCHEYPKER